MTQSNFPEPLRGGDVDSFAEHTVRVRMPALAARVIADNSFSAEINARLTALQHEIPNGSIRQLADPKMPHMQVWADAIAPYVGQTWLDVPWLFAEIYQHARILEATRYFENGIDPFALQKRQALESALDEIRPIAAQLPRWIEAAYTNEGLAELLALAMWGNQADLGLFPIGTERPSHETVAQRTQATLIDHHAQVVDWLTTQLPGRIDILLDNSGLELCSDLALTSFLLATGLAKQVVLHCKSVPYFVSDATATDIDGTIRAFADDTSPALNRLAQQLTLGLQNGQIVVTTAPEWTLPQPYWALPHSIRNYFPNSTLIISKGDLNYRRWVGDLAWPYSTPAAEVLHYVACSLLLLRTLKSEVLIGLPVAKVERLNSAEVDWLTSGRYGVIQFHNPRG